MLKINPKSRTAQTACWLAAVALVLAPLSGGGCLCAAETGSGVVFATVGRAANNHHCCAVKRKIAPNRLDCCQASANHACKCRQHGASSSMAGGHVGPAICSCQNQPAEAPVAPLTTSSDHHLVTVQFSAMPMWIAEISPGALRGPTQLDAHVAATSLERCILLSRFVI